MFNSPTASITAAMRPGMVAGHYPERVDLQQDWAEQMLATLQPLWAPLRHNRYQLRRVVKTINHHEKALAQKSDAQISAQLIELQHNFRRQGLCQPLCSEAFALIRETATRTIGQRHYDVQLMAGWSMLHGQLAEMETGEGKTLAATLAAATAALAGIPVHVITVNDYLVQRDAEQMTPLYQALGLRIGYVTQQMSEEQRQSNYACDITYASNKQLVFDYLRDRLRDGGSHNQLRQHLQLTTNVAHESNKRLLRGLCFAIVDEADSVLIDEARTPLILTRTVNCNTEKELYIEILNLTRQLKQGDDFNLSTADNHIELHLTGQQKINTQHDQQTTMDRHSRYREELVILALQALHQLKRGSDYLVIADKIVLIDANTGRKMCDRSWERGLQQLVELKENCPLSDRREQLGRLTYQRFFRRYLRLGGMTGTAMEVRSELHKVYRLHVQRIPLHKPSCRQQLPSQVVAHNDDKWPAIIEATQSMIRQGRPVLIGTGSVNDSELLSKKLSAANIHHRVLNALQDEQEATIIATAGQRCQVTVATNMAGRGTDIPLADGVAELGGLHVIRSCRNDAQRIDRQLTGRSARQGDPGSHQAILSLEDAGLRRNSSSAIVQFFIRRTIKQRLLQQRLNLYLIRTAQRRKEQRHRQARQALLRHDHQINQRLAFSGNLE